MSARTLKKTKQPSRKHSRQVRSTDLQKIMPQYSSVPAFKIYDNRGNANVVMNLEPGQTVYTNGSTMVWMDAEIQVKTTTGGIFRGLKRAFTGDSMFLTYYTGVSPKGNKICFASHLPGDMTKIVIQPGAKKVIANNSVVCCTGNVKLDTKFSMRGIFAGDAFLSAVSVPADSPEPGVVWLGAFGSIEVIEIKDGEKYKVDNYHFLASDSKVGYTLGKVGGLKSAILSGEGIVMNFTGPCKLMIQNRKLHDFAYYVSAFIPHD